MNGIEHVVSTKLPCQYFLSSISSEIRKIRKKIRKKGRIFCLPLMHMTSSFFEFMLRSWPWSWLIDFQHVGADWCVKSHTQTILTSATSPCTTEINKNNTLTLIYARMQHEDLKCHSLHLQLNLHTKQLLTKFTCKDVVLRGKLSYNSELKMLEYRYKTKVTERKSRFGFI